MIILSFVCLLRVLSAAVTESVQPSIPSFSSPLSCSGSLLDDPSYRESAKAETKYPLFLSAVVNEDGTVAAHVSKQIYQQLKSQSKNIPLITDQEKDKFYYANRHKNRYVDIVPYERSRVILSPIEDGQEDTTYINASYLTLNDTGLDEYKYIAAQAPTPHSVEDFWRMCWEQGVDSILMLVHPHHKCGFYWNFDGALKFNSGLVVHYQSSVPFGLPTSDMTYMAVSTFVLTWNGETKVVKHYNYLNWPDNQTPQMDEFQDFYKRLRENGFRQSTSVVHCSAGVGRTGTFCVFDQIVHLVENGLAGDIPDPVTYLILKFRDQRYGMVQTHGQLGFIYEALHAYFTQIKPAQEQ